MQNVEHVTPQEHPESSAALQAVRRDETRAILGKGAVFSVIMGVAGGVVTELVPGTDIKSGVEFAVGVTAFFMSLTGLSAVYMRHTEPTEATRHIQVSEDS